MSLARRFNAGTGWLRGCRRVATIEFTLVSGVATRREGFVRLFPALKGRAKLISTLRVDGTCSELPSASVPLDRLGGGLRTQCYYSDKVLDIGILGKGLGLWSYAARPGELCSKLICHVHQFRERAGLHFRHYLAAMDFDSFLADAKFESNLFVKHAGYDQRHHFSLSLRQRTETSAQFREFGAVFSGEIGRAHV